MSDVVGWDCKTPGESLGDQLELGAVVAMERGDDTVNKDLHHAERRRRTTARRAVEGEVKAELVAQSSEPTLDYKASTRAHVVPDLLHRHRRAKQNGCQPGDDVARRGRQPPRQRGTGDGARGRQGRPQAAEPA